MNTLKNDEMVEVPMDNARGRDRPEGFHILAVTVAFQTEFFGSSHHIGSVDPIAGYAGFDSHNLQGHIAAVISKNHRQRSSAAFRRFHLIYRRRLTRLTHLLSPMISLIFLNSLSIG